MPNDQINQVPNQQNLNPDEAQATLAWMTNLLEQQIPQAQPEAPMEPEMPQNEPQTLEPNEIPPQENEALETPNPVEELKDTIKEEIGGLRGFIQKLFGKEEKESETDKTN